MRERGKEETSPEERTEQEGRKRGKEKILGRGYYPVEIPRFVRRRFQFYYRHEGLRSSRDGRDADLVKDKMRDMRPKKFLKRNCKVCKMGREEGTFKRRTGSIGGSRVLYTHVK